MMSEREAEFVERKRFDDEAKRRAMRIYREKDAAYADADRKDKEAREALITEFDLQIQDVRPLIVELQHIHVHPFLTVELPILDYEDKWQLSEEKWLETWRRESPKIIHALRRIWAAIPRDEKLDGHIVRAVELMILLQRPAVLPPIDPAEWQSAEERAQQELEGELRERYDQLLSRADPARDIFQLAAEVSDVPQSPKPASESGQTAWATHVEIARIASINVEALRKRLDRFRKTHANDWSQVEGAKPREPRYIYRVNAPHILAIVEKMKASKRPAKRPAK